MDSPDCGRPSGEPPPSAGPAGYGTIIVDLERNRILDLLPDRNPDSVAKWLHEHPAIHMVARDRAEVYGSGVRQGAPAATHVADRWHLLRNLGHALETVLGQNAAALRQAARETVATLAPTVPVEPEKAPLLSATLTQRAAKHEVRQSRHVDLVKLQQTGASISAMARTLGMDQKTVRAWLNLEEAPSWSKRRTGSTLDAQAVYLQQRWDVGCRRISVLQRELAARGCSVPRTTLQSWIKTRLAAAGPPNNLAAPLIVGWKQPSPRRTARLLQSDVTTLTDADRQFVTRLQNLAPTLACSVDLVRRLAAILRKETAEALGSWLDAATTTPLKAFASGLAKDREAVEAAISEPWSTSPVEGQINRLKLIKRTMYGRGGFQLLRSRVLQAV